DTNSGQQLLALEGHAASVCGVNFGPLGRRIATGSNDGTARLWDSETGEPLLEVSAGRGINNVVFSPDGSRIATTQRDGTAKIWNVSDQGGGELLVLSGSSPVGGVAFGPDSLATRTQDGLVSVFRWPSGEQLFEVEGGRGPGRVALSPDGSQLGGPGPDSTALIWEADSGQVVHTLEAHLEPVLSVAFSHGGEWIATSSDEGTVALWHAATGEERPGEFQAYGFLATRAPPFTLHASFVDVYTAEFTPDDEVVLSAGEDGVAQLSEVPTGRALRRFNNPTAVRSATVSPDGRRLAYATEGGAVEIWSVGTPDGSLADVETIQRWQILEVSGSAVNDVAFSPDGNRLATGSADGVVQIWDVASGADLLAIALHDGAVTDVEFSRDGRYLATGGSDGFTHVLVLEASELIELAESRVTRSFTDAECQRYLHVEACP
ncbi:MAG: WD40 repeat domain-containing protein, partial [Acidimicrobiia bacterium]